MLFVLPYSLVVGMKPWPRFAVVAGRSIEVFVKEAEKLSVEARSLEANVDSYERDLEALQAANRALLAQLEGQTDTGQSSYRSDSFIEDAGMTNDSGEYDPPMVSPLHVGRLVESNDDGKLGDSEDDGTPVVMSSRSYQRDTTIEWRQGEMLGEGAYSKVFIGMNKVRLLIRSLGCGPALFSPFPGVVSCV